MAELLEDKTSDGKASYVPVRACRCEFWIDEKGELLPVLKDLKHDIGNMLNEAVAVVDARTMPL